MKKSIVIILLMLVRIPTYSLTIFVAPIEYYTEDDARREHPPVNIREHLTGQLEALFNWYKVNFIALDIITPRSFLDAIKVSNENNLDYLLYGFIEKKEYSLYGEIKLFDSQRREVVQAFFSSDDPSQLDRLIADLAGKMESYFMTLLNLSPSGSVKPVPTEGIFSFALGGGYWTPLMVEWSEYIQSLYSACFQIRFIPWRPAAGPGFRGVYFKSGLAADFYHGENQPGYVDSTLLNFTLGIPASLCLDIGIRHTISLTILPQFSMDYLITEQLYSDTATTYGFLFSGAVDMEYQFHFTKYLSMNIGNRFMVQFLNPPRMTYNPFLMFEMNLNPLPKTKGDTQ